MASTAASAEWSQVESSIEAITPSTDLFDGDILGDELMDIYNAAVVGGGDDPDDMTGTKCDDKVFFRFTRRVGLPS